MKIIISNSITDADRNEMAHNEAMEKTGFWGKQGSGCLVLASDTGNLLVAHRSDVVLQPNTWGTWGGAVDLGEDPETSMLRELKEEAGYSGEITSIIPMYKFKSGSFVYHNYIVVVPSEFVPKLDRETQDYIWCGLDAIPRPKHSGLIEFLSRDKKKIQALVAKYGNKI